MGMPCVEFAAILLGCIQSANAAEDIEFVAEHLAEVPMDNRFATLPLWNNGEAEARRWEFAAQAAFSSTRTGELTNAGTLTSLAASRVLKGGWTIGVFGFADRLTLSGDDDHRPLQTLFSPGTPLARPVAARFDDLDGTMNHVGAGIQVSKLATSYSVGMHRWVAGIVWERIELSDYRLTYQILEGESSGVTGQIDFDAQYQYVTPFLGLEFPRPGVRWAFSPHVLLAWPFSKRGVVGHINGPGFDLRGNTADAGNGTHFGDPSLTIGFDVTYLPAHLTIDVGTLVTQRLIEPLINKGIEANWLLSCQVRY